MVQHTSDATRDGVKTIAVIPARGGSKRIPRKNSKHFFGQPMIAWSIEAAKASNVFDEIIVSTDDAEIAAIAQHYGASVPFMRPAALADDYTGTIEVIAHAIQWALNEGWQLDAVCCIYATAPFIQVTDLQQGRTILAEGNGHYVFPVTEFAAPIFRSFEVTKENRLSMFFPEHFHTRSQDLPTAYHDAGQFYWGQTEAWLEAKPLFDQHSTPLIIPRWRVQDIDTEADWQQAERMAAALAIAAPAKATPL